MKKTFYSNGKLLITGEYLVLDGAKAFALPTKFGQNLNVEEGENQEFSWKSYNEDGTIWFQDTIPFSEIINPIIAATPSVKSTLITILNEAYKMQPAFINTSKGYQITTELSFPKKWGLGTSSTLINNIAQWLQIDAFELLKTSFGGSGYDIACAQNDSPITYQLQKGKSKVENIKFRPDFTDAIYFIYLNKKQNSKTAIANYQNNKAEDIEKSIITINKLTTEVLQAKAVTSFGHALEKHEAEMSYVLETSTVKESLFSDFNGQVKSLGAWGGDFVMVVSEVNPKTYFNSKGFNTILTYDEMILK
ncbi:GYDIA family GHMP kinase [Flavobacterium sp. WC2430]|uniref:GYDIA family GHMP kinase n=1 Tax=Flavobacterium sp. WC2430 TaxID=3234137 RepID=UPI00346527C0